LAEPPVPPLAHLRERRLDPLEQDLELLDQQRGGWADRLFDPRPPIVRGSLDGIAPARQLGRRPPLTYRWRQSEAEGLGVGEEHVRQGE
jgi:hypothetical protein